MTTDEKIAAFARAYRVNVLDVADMLMNSSKSGKLGNPLFDDVPFAVLFLLFSYFEMIAKLEAGYTGRAEPEKYFGDGLRSVLPELASLGATDRESLKKRLYKHARCGYYHLGMVLDNKIVVNGEPADIVTLDGQKIRINPHRLVCRIKEHFAQVENKLSSPAERAKFEQWFDANFHL